MIAARARAVAPSSIILKLSSIRAGYFRNLSDRRPSAGNFNDKSLKLPCYDDNVDILREFKKNFEGCVAAIRQSISSGAGNRPSLSRTSARSESGSDCHSSDLYSLVINIPEISLSKLTTSGQIQVDKDALRKITFERETDLREITGRFTESASPQIVDLNRTMCGFLLPSHLKWPFLSSSMKQDRHYRLICFSVG